MPTVAPAPTASALFPDVRFDESWLPRAAMCDEREPRRDSEPAIFPSLLFTEDEVRAVNWEAVFAEW